MNTICWTDYFMLLTREQQKGECSNREEIQRQRLLSNVDIYYTVPINSLFGGPKSILWSSALITVPCLSWPYLAQIPVPHWRSVVRPGPHQLSSSLVLGAEALWIKPHIPHYTFFPPSSAESGGLSDIIAVGAIANAIGYTYEKKKM